MFEIEHQTEKRTFEQADVAADWLRDIWNLTFSQEAAVYSHYGLTLQTALEQALVSGSLRYPLRNATFISQALTRG